MKTYVGSYKTFESSQFSSCSVSVDCALLCSKSVVILNRAIWVMTHEWISLKLIFSVSALCRYVKYMLNTTNVWGILNMYANSYLPLSNVLKYLCSFGFNRIRKRNTKGYKNTLMGWIFENYVNCRSRLIYHVSSIFIYL